MLSPEFSRLKFEAGLAYAEYVRTGTPDQQASWNRTHAQVRLTDSQKDVLRGFTRRVNILVSSGTWCGDCVAQVPMLDHIARAAKERVVLRILNRDSHMDLAEKVRICGGYRVPTVIFLNEDFDLVGLSGDKSLSRMRAVAARRLGASCPLPGAEAAQDEVAATLSDWVNEVERVHLLVRLSTKLRARYQD